MRLAPPSLFAALVALAAPAAAVGQVPYTFVRIANAGPGTGSAFATLFPPSLNGTDTVSFGANLVGGGQAILTGNGTTTSTVAQTGTQTGTGATFTGFSATPVDPIFTTINPGSSQVAFFATTTAGAGVFRGTSGLPPTPIATTANGFTAFSSAPGINPAGTVSFGASATTGQGVFRGDGTTTTQVAATGPTPQGIVTGFNFVTAINGLNVVSLAAQYSNGRQAIFATSGGTPTEIASNDVGTGLTAFAGPTAINASNRVAFVAARTIVAGGGKGVFTGTGGALTTIATTGGAYNDIADFVSMTTGGAVVFAANLTAGGQGIFTGPDPVANRIIRTGDALDGSTVTTLTFFPRAVNDLGRVTFLATLVNGRQGVYLAIPVPEPAGVLLVAGAGLAAGAWWRRRGG
jgi:PEP-CTERM motif